MKKLFITYGDKSFQESKNRLIAQAKSFFEFDETIVCGPEDLSAELLASDIIRIPRGGGLWSWKPDIILSTMSKYNDGDIIVYCDAGCTLYPSPEWKRYWKKLEKTEQTRPGCFFTLIYKYLSNSKTKNRIYTQWEHIENCGPFFKQAIRATRLRNGEEERKKDKLIDQIIRVVKDCIYKPFFNVRHKMNGYYG